MKKFLIWRNRNNTVLLYLFNIEYIIYFCWHFYYFYLNKNSGGRSWSLKNPPVFILFWPYSQLTSLASVGSWTIIFSYIYFLIKFPVCQPHHEHISYISQTHTTNISTTSQPDLSQILAASMIYFINISTSFQQHYRNMLATLQLHLKCISVTSWPNLRHIWIHFILKSQGQSKVL